jgi:hypothetical protein
VIWWESIFLSIIRRQIRHPFIIIELVCLPSSKFAQQYSRPFHHMGWAFVLYFSTCCVRGWTKPEKKLQRRKDGRTEVRCILKQPLSRALRRYIYPIPVPSNGLLGGLYEFDTMNSSCVEHLSFMKL